MTIEEAIKRAEETAIGEDELCKRYDRASGYSRNHDETIRTTDAKRCEKIAQEHRQLAEWLKDYKRLLESSSESPNKSEIPTGSTTNNLALIHTEGLDEEIRCTMCTNSMKSDRGCDGSCVVNNAMYKNVMDAIEKRIQPTTKNDLGVDYISRQDVLSEIIRFSTEEGSSVECQQLYCDVNNMPSATPIRPKGHWKTDRQGDMQCSRCGHQRPYFIDYTSEGCKVRGKLTPFIEKINKMKSEIADSLEFWDYSPNNNPLARDMLETITNFWGDVREVEE
jgi:hypothetical protein